MCSNWYFSQNVSLVGFTHSFNKIKYSDLSPIMLYLSIHWTLNVDIGSSSVVVVSWHSMFVYSLNHCMGRAFGGIFLKETGQGKWKFGDEKGGEGKQEERKEANSLTLSIVIISLMENNACISI